MPSVRLSVQNNLPPMRVVLPLGGTVEIPTLQYRCLLRLPNYLLPQDGIIDPGAPHIIFPRTLWNRFREGIDFEWLPFAAGVVPPVAQLARWQFTFQIARFLGPLGLMDYSTEIDRPEVIAAFADSDPRMSPTRLVPPPIIIGLWGGLLEGGKIAVSRTASGQIEGALEFP